MCGIFAFYAKESVPNKNVIYQLFKYASKRGTDSFGYIIIRKNHEPIVYYFAYEDEIIKHSTFAHSLLKVGDVLIGIARSAPETEIVVDNFSRQNSQPICHKESKLYLVHNGAVSNQSYQNLDSERSVANFEKTSNIDSEAILWAYELANYDIKDALENKGLSGGWSFILMDVNKWRLISACSANPLTHGYIKGVGYFIHSVEDVYPAMMKFLGRRVDKCGSVMWEDFYWHERDGFRFFELDLDSGVQTADKYSHYFIHPHYNEPSLKQKEKNYKNNKYLVCASGGLDSTTTALLVQEHDCVVELVHFQYGHRGEDAELDAIQKISKQLDCKLKIFNFKDFYKDIDDFSMLTNKDQKITTGMNPKTTSAWSCGRNMLFLSTLGAYAESLIMKYNYSNIYICSGMSSLTESGSYPDNTEKFIYAMQQVWKYGTLPGANGRIKHINVCANITKYEQVLLLEYYNKLNLIKDSVSCDRPIFIDGEYKQCSCIHPEYGNMPACGSGLLSWWAMTKANIKDERKYYLIDDKEYKPFIPKWLSTKQKINHPLITDILGKLILD